jgi:hypothetical protein
VQKIQHSGGPLYAKSLGHIGFRSSLHIRNPNIQVQVSKFSLDGEFHGILSQVSIGKKKKQSQQHGGICYRGPISVEITQLNLLS